MKTLIAVLFIFGSMAHAESYSEFTERVEAGSAISKNEGLSYMISGGIALAGGLYGFNQAEKSVEKGFYTLAQSLGILAIGFGAESYFLKQDDEIFLQVLNAGDLTRAQKDKMVTAYLQEKKDRADSLVWIRRSTFGLAGLLNLVYAAQSKDQALQNFLYVTAGVQLVWAVTF